MALRDIFFFVEDVDFKVRDKKGLREWIALTIREEEFKRIAELNVVFCSDEYLLAMNQQYLEHDTLTDIITFDNSDDEDTIAGDIFISVERVQENAQKFGVPVQHELHRVIIHGVLHLCGYYDKTCEDKQQMTEREDYYLHKKGLRKI